MNTLATTWFIPFNKFNFAMQNIHTNIIMIFLTSNIHKWGIENERYTTNIVNFNWPLSIDIGHTISRMGVDDLDYTQRMPAAIRVFLIVIFKHVPIN